MSRFSSGWARFAELSTHLEMSSLYESLDIGSSTKSSEKLIVLIELKRFLMRETRIGMKSIRIMPDCWLQDSETTERFWIRRQHRYAPSWWMGSSIMTDGGIISAPRWDVRQTLDWLITWACIQAFIFCGVQLWPIAYRKPEYIYRPTAFR